MKQPIDYLIRVRRNSDLALLGEVTNYARLDAIPRFNDVGRWTLEIGEETPAGALLTSKANGIILERNVHDGNGFVPFLSGRIDHIERQGGTSHNLLISGPDDTCVLKDRLALCNPTFPIYATLINSFSPAIYWRLGESSGSSAGDASGHGNTGTYGSAVTYSVTPGIDDPDTAITLPGNTNGKITCTPGNPTSVTGNFTVIIWAKQGTTGKLFGSRSPNETSFDMGLQASAPFVHGDIGNGTAWATTVADSTLSAMPTTPWWCIAYVVTPTGYKIYVNGVVAGSGSYTSITPICYDANHHVFVGASGAASDIFCNGSIDEFCIIPSPRSDAEMLRIYQTGLSRYGYQYSDHQTGVAETVLKHYVNVNAGPAARPEFQTANLTIETDSGIGNTISADARNEVLLDKLKEVAIKGGDLGFRVVQVGTSLQFQVYQPPDVSSNAKFSEQLGNLADFAYSIDAPAANYIIGGGQGEGTARAFTEASDATSISDWGRTIVAFYDDRGATDRAKHQNDVAGQLDQSKEQTTFQAQPIDTDALQWGVDYDLGSKVSVIVNGSAVTDLIREVEITVTPDQGSIVKPGIGTVGSGQIEAILTHYQQELKRLRTLVQRLQAHS